MAGGCFSLGRDLSRRYWVLTCERTPGQQQGHFPGLVRVRDLDAESAYDRFQMVVRKSAYELTYRERDVWAVKPSRMLADIVARTLVAENLFGSVTRELSERRPQYLLSGELHAIEIVQSSAGQWSVHLGLSLAVTDFESGQNIWSHRFDASREVARRDFAGAVEALSVLGAEACERAVVSLRQVPVQAAGGRRGEAG